LFVKLSPLRLLQHRCCSWQYPVLTRSIA